MHAERERMHNEDAVVHVWSSVYSGNTKMTQHILKLKCQSSERLYLKLDDLQKRIFSGRSERGTLKQNPLLFQFVLLLF